MWTQVWYKVLYNYDQKFEFCTKLNGTALDITLISVPYILPDVSEQSGVLSYNNKEASHTMTVTGFHLTLK